VRDENHEISPLSVSAQLENRPLTAAQPDTESPGELSQTKHTARDTRIDSLFVQIRYQSRCSVHDNVGVINNNINK